MRISDWSSDVCSSDLRLVLRFVGNWVRERTDFPYIDDPSQPERLKGELGDPIYAFNFSADYTYKKFTLGYELRYIGRQSITDWEAQHETYGVPALDPYYADRVYYRSEEHTSELQSLMRISYAVFCLKKNQSKLTS